MMPPIDASAIGRSGFLGRALNGFTGILPLNERHFPIDAPFLDREPCKAWRRAFRAGNATWVKEPHALDRLVARNMRVAMQEDVALRWAYRGNVLEMEADAGNREIQCERPVGLLVAVSPDDSNRGKLAQRGDDHRVAYVSK